jgi:hypothetical protein
MFTISSISESDELDSDELDSDELLPDEELDSDELLSDDELDSDELDSDELISDELDSDELVSAEVDLNGILVKAVRCFTLSALFSRTPPANWSLSILIINVLNLISLIEK